MDDTAPMEEAETLLHGGNLNRVVRVGNTVRRLTGPWSEAVHGLLRHLERQGFTEAPRYLGRDGQGREILTFLPGEVGFQPYIWSEEALPRIAQLLRLYHDATVGYVAPPDAGWYTVFPDATRHEVICHNDFAPYNLVFVDEMPAGLIDFDVAGPGPRIWDVAFAAYYFAPLSYSGDLRNLALKDLEAGSRRLHRFCEAYGIAATVELLDGVEQRLNALCDDLRTKAEAGNAAYRKMVDEGHLAYYEREITAFRAHREPLEQNLTLLENQSSEGISAT